MNTTGKHFMGCAMVMAILAGMLIAGCTQPAPTPTPTPTATPTATATPVAHSPDTLLIATTTSLYDTGLLNAVQDYYQNKTGINLKITSQGTGIAIQVATRGDCDLLLVHSPSQEKAFIDKGLGINQRCFAYNYFMIVGPESDPAGIRGQTPEAAFQKLYMLGVNKTPNIFFTSRGDQSGTHSAEQTIWTKAGFNYTNQVVNAGPWYLSVGKGMGETLTLASQKGSYTLTDEGTFLAFKSQLNLVPLITQGGSLLNRYSAIAVNPEKQNANVNILEADRFINWLISDEGKQFVGNYGVDKYGKSLFTPLMPYEHVTSGGMVLETPMCGVTPFNCTCDGAVSPA